MAAHHAHRVLFRREEPLKGVVSCLRAIPSRQPLSGASADPAVVAVKILKTIVYVLAASRRACVVDHRCATLFCLGCPRAFHLCARLFPINPSESKKTRVKFSHLTDL